VGERERDGALEVERPEEVLGDGNEAVLGGNEEVLGEHGGEDGGEDLRPLVRAGNGDGCLGRRQLETGADVGERMSLVSEQGAARGD
jgi:hypothetical protein